MCVCAGVVEIGLITGAFIYLKKKWNKKFGK